MSVTYGVETVAAVLDDDTSRCILLAARREPKSVTALCDCCNASRTTIYRRLDDLERCEFLLEETRIERDGNHHTVYRTNVRRVSFEIAADGIELAVDRDEPMADRFTRLVEEI